MPHPFPAELVSCLNDARIVNANLRVKRNGSPNAVALHDVHQPPDSHAHTVVTPGIIQHIGNEARSGICHGSRRAIEKKVLNVRNYPYGDASAVRPAQRFSVHNCGIRKTGLVLWVSSRQLSHGGCSPIKAPAPPETAAARKLFRYW